MGNTQHRAFSDWLLLLSDICIPFSSLPLLLCSASQFKLQRFKMRAVFWLILPPWLEKSFSSLLSSRRALPLGSSWRQCPFLGVISGRPPSLGAIISPFHLLMMLYAHFFHRIEHRWLWLRVHILSSFCVILCPIGRDPPSHSKMVSDAQEEKQATFLP